MAQAQSDLKWVLIMEALYQKWLEDLQREEPLTHFLTCYFLKPREVREVFVQGLVKALDLVIAQESARSN